MAKWTEQFITGARVQMRMPLDGWENGTVIGRTSSGHLRIKLDSGQHMTGPTKADLRRLVNVG